MKSNTKSWKRRFFVLEGSGGSGGGSGSRTLKYYETDPSAAGGGGGDPKGQLEITAKSIITPAAADPLRQLQLTCPSRSKGKNTSTLVVHAELPSEAAAWFQLLQQQIDDLQSTVASAPATDVEQATTSMAASALV